MYTCIYTGNETVGVIYGTSILMNIEVYGYWVNVSYLMNLLGDKLNLASAL